MQYFRAFGKVIQRPLRTALFKNKYVPSFTFKTDKPEENPLFASFLQQQQKPQREPILNEELKELGLIEDYKEAIRCTIDKNYHLAESYFNKTLDILKSDDREFKPRILVHVLNKLAVVLYMQGREEELTNVMEDLYFISSADTSCGYNVTFKSFANLLTHYSIVNPKRGVVFAETVLEQHKSEPIPLQFLQDVYYFVGSIYLIAGDYKKAIEFLEESLAMKPDPVIRGMALHNTAMAYWWDYCDILQKERINTQKEIEQQFQNIETQNDEEFKAKMARLESKNKTIIPKLKQAIKSFELLYGDDPVKFPRKEEDKLTPRQFMAMTNLLDENLRLDESNKWKSEDIVLKNPNSALSTLALGEMYYHIGYMKQAMFWNKVSLDLSVKTFSVPRNLRNMVILAQINIEQNNTDFAEKMFLDCLKYMEGMQIYNKIICLESYAHYLGSCGRKYESEEYYKQAHRLKAKVPEWQQRRELMHLPDYQLL